MKSLKSIRFIIALFVIQTCSLNGHAQSIDSLKLDSLISVLTLQNEDEATADAYLGLSDEYIGISDYESSMEYAMLGRDMAAHIGDDERELSALMRIAHLNLSYYLDFKEAVRHYDEALVLAKKLGSRLDELNVYQGYTNAYTGVEDYDNAAVFNVKSIELARELGDDKLISDLSAYGGNIYEELGDMDKALEMYEEVIDIEEKTNFMNTSNASMTVVAHYYYLKEDYEKSLRHYRSALKRFERLGDLRWVSYVHAEISIVYLESGDLDRAEKHALKGLEIAQDLKLNKERADNYYVLAQVYKEKGDEENAKKYQDAYDNLMDSVVVDLGDRSVNGERELQNSAEEDQGSSLLSLFLILGLTVLVVFISGLPSRKRG